jgi:threonine/homoserine/homoserine lactone efflux protein
MLEKSSSLLQGFSFGMMLQMAIGPVCLFILNVASEKGFLNAEFGVVGVTLIDASYIGLAMAGLAKLINGERTRKYLGYFGVIVLLLFGLTMLFEGIAGVQSHARSTIIRGGPLKTFSTAIILTASNPLTILFWTGIFSTKISQQKSERHLIPFFALGCVWSTLIFLTLVCITGSLLHYIFPGKLMKVFTGLVGLWLIAYAVKGLPQLYKKRLHEG